MAIKRAVLAGVAVVVLVAGFMLWQDSQLPCVESIASGARGREPWPSGGPILSYRECD